MAEYLDASWPVSWDAPSKRDRQGGRYRAYIPDRLRDRNFGLNPEIASRSGVLEARLRELSEHAQAHCLDSLARFLLRSEAIASSRIEGLAASPQKIALAELAAQSDEPVRGFTDSARLVANNIAVLRDAVGKLATTDTVSVEDVCELHRGLLPDERHHGLRTVQNWIGGGEASPLHAMYVPPPPGQVAELMEDLMAYVNSAGHAPLIQAALVHAQFETIHPFTDGNGRLGRALIHTVLTRRGLTRTAVLPISLALRTMSNRYVDGLTAYRYEGRSDSVEANCAVNEWLQVFIDATQTAVAQADSLLVQLEELLQQWRLKHQQFRNSQGLRPEPRSGSAVSRLLSSLPEAPMLTARSVQKLLGVTHPAAKSALEELAASGILHRKQVERGTTGYLARDVFDLLVFAERQLASTQWDTKLSPPVRVVPASPQR